ncbi:MAG: ribosome biogenesis GTPase Der [Saprospiraceae bacterium]|jgi:GTP-binding protein|uniref:ribosome biogenesis GTPase Der n=1 Tax=Candidatus Brachybacter algidus TaxID=2982024 RepID=UPI001B5DB228|nr:ribosome biogenesis GTPase Der [Candidatus Brachybacter algidus]MBP7305260.1 ribosome biogenesis GTPase Der [Saprospiraceae bacterium]MBK6449229.1 ribosome biogenesis GTPase Der [Candidatus Brachybacter algidus]MBK8603400.1 ribosome biogenesis GTPase Der [Candidatus Brachybacter algidus]MBK8844395.1 ribosome biogenesis GTPase Der [Candidatus Brachybacter algidus]MBK9025307.1 ribosome biogenesis GTPase Der [Candidatus Brachybacter algidus]
MSNIVAIVGRPNVGKSTLFNRLIGKKQAIIDDVSGVTRDRQYGEADWNGKSFIVVDTGGFVQGSDDVFEKAIRDQVHIAIEEAGAIIFMVDFETGETDLDSKVAKMLRQSNKNVILVVNKIDNAARFIEAQEFWGMGFKHTHFLSSISGSGTGEILDDLMPMITDPETLNTDLPKIAIIGQPNVGKSSYTNVLLGEERNIVTDIAGTTRDSIHTRYNLFNKEFYIIDTAGIRKKQKVNEDLEFYSVMRAIRAIEEADVCALLIDAQTGIEAQDMSIFRLVQKRNKGIAIFVNKWDLVDKETNTARDFEAEVKERLAPFNDVPVIFISALEKTRIFKSIEVLLDIYENKQKKIMTSKLNDVMLPIIEKTPPPSYRGKMIKIKYITQLHASHPVFGFFCNYPDHILESYKQFLENQMRKNFDFSGVKISIVFKEK